MERSGKRRLFKGDKALVRFENVTFEYIRRDEEGNVDGITTALDDLSLHIRKGEFIAILGSNGSGKSTLARHINALLSPTKGKVLVAGYDTCNVDDQFKIRQSAGMVFQNPDNQIIAETVEEDVAFGPENMGIPVEEMTKRVDDSLKRVGLYKKRLESPNRLSGGQKQKVAIAGILAMKPECIIFDEPTAMLDPVGRRMIIETAHELNKKDGITIVLITHNMEETVGADRIVVIEKGKIVMEGTPRQVFSKGEELKSLGMELPVITELAQRIGLEGCVLTREEFVKAFERAQD
ncbi:MAG: energy-coupling factor transporter ATPase [Lachnospiraceae bacterium]|nr:energy-coupling factor transporter ATPase [Lachnospiraceae bacterium]